MASNNNSLQYQWKEQPCHFFWNLSAGVLTDFENIARNIDNDLEVTPDLLRVDQLLFRAYLEVSDRSSRWNVSKAREFLDEADDYIQNQTEPELQRGYRSVALLNRIWIEHKSQNNTKVDELLSELDGLRLGETDRLVVKTLLANALTRVGPSMITRSLQIYEEALQQFPDNAGFLYGALLMTGRKMRLQRSHGAMYDYMDEDGKKLMDQEKEYCEKLIKVKDNYQLGKAALGLNLSRRGETSEALKLLREARRKVPNSTAVFHNLMKCHRFSANAKKDIPISTFRKAIRQRQCLDVPESHNQLALCFIAKAKFFKTSSRKKQYRVEALKELDTCLEINKMHNIASLKRARVLECLSDFEEAERTYEAMLQKSEHYLPQDKLSLFFEYAKFLRNRKSSSELHMWQNVMDITSSFEYLDEISCKWEVRAQAKGVRAAAYHKLFHHYLGKENEDLRLGILHFQNFEFEKAGRRLSLLDPTTNLDIPCYLVETCLKWGQEKEMSVNSTQDARECFMEAHRNVLVAREQSLDQTLCRKLLSDTSLAIAHINLYTYPSEQSHTSQSLTAIIPIASDCIESYREAIRCGSLVASVEVLRLIKKEFLQKTPRSKLFQILSEVHVCCSQRLSDCLHRTVQPRSFENGLKSQATDVDTFALDRKAIKRDISTMLRQDLFFRQAWAQHFEMEKKVLEERFMNNEGREESSTGSVSIEEMYAAIDCCKQLRPLLDHTIVMFEKSELDMQEERKKQYFPLILEDLDSVRTEEVLKEKLQWYFEIKFEEHYPNLYKQLLEVQPGYNSQNGFLKTFYTLVNHVKHSGTQPQEILQIVQDPVKLARQCTDKVEEICNFFFDAMKESSDLREKVKDLVTDLKGYSKQTSSTHESCEKADQLLGLLSDHEDFIVRMGSTWKLLEMLALIRGSRMHSDQHVVIEEAEDKMAQGTWDPSKNLRRSHLEVEVSLLQTGDPSAIEVLEKCRDTCKEADRLLNEVMKKNQQAPQDYAEVEFPFRDMHPGGDITSWKGKVKKQIKRYLKENGVNPTDELLKVMLQAQPCSSEDNYNFLLMREFLKECDANGGKPPSSVSIQTDNGEVKSLDAVDLTRWCTNNAEKIALHSTA